MDPDCAICHAPASQRCDCEAKGLEVAVQDAETRMMHSIYSRIRTWVREHAQDYILEYFRLLTERRKHAHAQHMERLQAHAYHYYYAPPHPHEVAEAEAALKRGIDEDWQASVQRYPEVLEYFYSLVELTVPRDADPAVKDPPLSALNGSKKAVRRSSTVVPETLHHRERERATPVPRLGRTPPPPPLIDRRTPGPTMGYPLAPPPRRHAFRPPHPPPPSNYYGY